MKRILQTYLPILLTYCQAYAQSDCNCWETEFTGLETDYSTAVVEMEKAFIDKGYLRDGKSSSYVELMDSIITKNEYYLHDVGFNPILVSKFEKCFFNNSCDHKTFEKIRKMNHLLTHYEDISPARVFGDFKEIFKKADLKKTAVKHYFLTFSYATFLNVKVGLLNFAPTETPLESSPLAKRNILRVYISQGDSIFVDDQYVEFQNLKQLVVKHISDSTDSPNSPEIELVKIEGLGERKVSKQLISLQNHRSTSYKLYVKVQDELIAAYKEVRNEIGLREFGVDYEQMLENRDRFEKEIKMIRKLLPQRISEADPISK